jgi:hypothetical protein
MFRWLSNLGASDKLSTDEISRLTELTRELAGDYGTPDLPGEFEKVTAKGEETERYFAELANAAQIASFIYQVARDVIPLLRKLARGSKAEQATMETKLVESAEKQLVPESDAQALKVKKRGLIRRVVTGLLRKD